MDIGTASILIIIIFACVIVAAFFVFRQRNRTTIRGPFGTELDMESSNDPPPYPSAIMAKNIKIRKGGLVADDHTGRGIKIEDASVRDDILLSSDERNDDPKDRPPQ